jgi:hypothetical protein
MNTSVTTSDLQMKPPESTGLKLAATLARLLTFSAATTASFGTQGEEAGPIADFLNCFPTNSLVSTGIAPVTSRAEETKILHLQPRFNQLADEWMRFASVHSSHKRIVDHASYREIISMGENALPFIFAYLQKGEPGHWFNALWDITSEQPFDPDEAGDVEKMVEAWVKWGAAQGYI